MLILNRDLMGRHVPAFRYADVAAEGTSKGVPTSPHTFAIYEFELFASTFDSAKYQVDTGIHFDESTDDLSNLASRVSNPDEKVDLGTLRWGLTMLALHAESLASDSSKAALADALLDAIHRDIAGGPRATIGPGKHEPFIGVWGALLGEGHLRFGIETTQEFDRNYFFDFAAGRLLRADGQDSAFRALALYPPAYHVGSETVTHHFMVLIAKLSDRKLDSIDSSQKNFADLVQREAIAEGVGLPPQAHAEN